MKLKALLLATAIVAAPVGAQDVTSAADPVPAQPIPVQAAPPAQIQTVTLPINTLVEVTPAAEITSKEMKERTIRPFLVARDVVENDRVVIQRGSAVTQR